MSGQTPSQTVGPYFAYGLAAQQYHYPHGQIVDGEIVGEGARQIASKSPGACSMAGASRSRMR